MSGSWDAMLNDEQHRADDLRGSALQRRRDLGTLSKADLIDAVLYAEGLKCKSCDRETGEWSICPVDGTLHPWMTTEHEIGGHS